MFLCDGGQVRLYYGGATELKPKKYQRALGDSGGQRKHKYEGQSRTSLGISGTKNLWQRDELTEEARSCSVRDDSQGL